MLLLANKILFHRRMLIILKTVEKLRRQNKKNNIPKITNKTLKKILEYKLYDATNNIIDSFDYMI